MSEQEFDSYLRLLARFLNLSGNQRAAIARELRTHMEDRLEDLLARGYAREDAIHTALDEFGDAAVLAGEFGRIGRRRRWIMRTATATIGIAAAVLLTSFLMPENRPWVPAPAYTQAGETTGAAPADRPAEKKVAPPPSVAVVPVQDYASDSESPADRKTVELLRQVLPVVDLAEGTTFADAVEFLRIQGKVSINVNWAALALMNVERTTDTGGLSVRDVKVETALNIILDAVSQAGGGAGRAAYDLLDGVIRVSTQDELNSRTVVRIYDCQDLIGQALTPAQKRALDAIRNPVRGGGRMVPPTTRPGAADPLASAPPAAGTPLGPMAGPRSEESSITDILADLRARDAQAFTSLITSILEPGTWEPDGSIGAVSEYDGLLVVRHTAGTQQQVSEFLRAIRKVKASRGADGQASASPSR